MIDVSVIVVSWNSRDLLRACLKSIFETTSGISFEVICVDNASNDGTAGMVRTDFPQVRLVANAANKRFVEANNQAILVARGRYVLLLNADTVVLGDAIEQTVRFADDRVDGAVFGCGVLNRDLSLQSSCFMYPSAVNSLLAATYLFKLFPRSRFFGRHLMTWWDHGHAREVEAISGCFSLVRKSAIDMIGLMDPIYYFYGDDIDWCYRFRKAGWSVWYVPRGRIIHLGGESSKHVRRLFHLQLFGSTLVFIGMYQGRVALLFARLSSALGFILRLPYWLVGSALSTTKRTVLLEAAKTGLCGAAYCLFDWKRLVQNPGDVERRIEEQGGRDGKPRLPDAVPDRTVSSL